jgi:hypothetical protein
LINSETDKVVKGFENLGKQNTIDLKGLDLSEFNLTVQVDDKAVESVKFESGLGDRVENIVPYALFGDVSGDFQGKSVGDLLDKAGKFSTTVKATAYSEKGGKGNAIATSSIDLTVLDTSAPAYTPISAITKENTKTLSDLGMIGGMSSVIKGTASDDKMIGTADDDKMIGVASKSALPGKGEKDVFVGNRGADTFILGNSDGIFYDDGNINNQGNQDFAWISDLSIDQGDVIQLHGDISDYSLGALYQADKQNLGIFAEGKGEKELIGVIQDAGNAISLESSAFQFV